MPNRRLLQKHGKLLRLRRRVAALQHAVLRERQGTLASVRDTTNHKQAQEALRESVARYRALVESQVDLISRYLPDTTLTFVNDAYCRFYGKTREQLIGHSFLTMVAPEFHEVVLKETQTSAQRAFLKRQGYQVLVATNGNEALKLASGRGSPIDLLLTDVVMPGMNGRELAERLLEVCPHMKVLYCSGYTENVIVHHGVVDEQLNFIGKPYSIEALARKVRLVLEQA